MGQTNVVYVTRLISKGSIETGMFSLAQRKLQLEKQVTGGIKGQLEGWLHNNLSYCSSQMRMKQPEIRMILMINQMIKMYKIFLLRQWNTKMFCRKAWILWVNENIDLIDSVKYFFTFFFYELMIVYCVFALFIF